MQYTSSSKARKTKTSKQNIFVFRSRLHFWLCCLYFCLLQELVCIIFLKASTCSAPFHRQITSKRSFVQTAMRRTFPGTSERKLLWFEWAWKSGGKKLRKNWTCALSILSRVFFSVPRTKKMNQLPYTKMLQHLFYTNIDATFIKLS